MIKWMIRRRVAAFERDFGYDASYMRQVLDHDLGAFFKFARLAGISEHRRDVPKDVYYAAKITGALTADCGPCTQLVVTMALRDGIPGATIAQVLEGDEAALTETARLGVRFARAVLARDLAADDMRAEIERRWGPRAVISLALALVSSQLYPTFKYALGHGKACARIDVEGRTIAPSHHDHQRAAEA